MKNEIVLTREEAQRLLTFLKFVEEKADLNRPLGKPNPAWEFTGLLSYKLSASAEPEACAECGGSGMAVIGPPNPSYERCPVCSGTGIKGGER